MNEQSPDQNNPQVVLACMPFGILTTPSLALSLLKPALTQAGISTRVVYFSFPFAQRIGLDAYQRLAKREEFSGYQEVGEWIFAQSLFPNKQLEPETYIEQILRNPPVELRRFIYPLPEELIQLAIEARSQVEPFLEQCIDEIAYLRPSVVGFTCLFQQKLASLSLARRIKMRLPETFILFGGPDCEGIKGAEIIRQFPFVDAVISGEADLVLPEVVRRILNRQSLSGLQGVYSQHCSSLADRSEDYLNAIPPTDLDTLPFIDSDNYFAQLESSQLSQQISPYLSFETSRGCWWGEVQQCTFCSINGKDMTFRSKSSQRSLEELSFVIRKYPTKAVIMTDSILNKEFFKEYLLKLARKNLGVYIQYETRATLKKDQMLALKKAGVTQIQPGIESLSSATLKLMRKGTSLLHNIQCLKWCQELDICAFWNILMGFPGELPSEYEKMARLIPLIVHLQPPSSIRWIDISHFSPLFENPIDFGLSNIRPSPAYDYIYPFDSEANANLATYFVYSYHSPQDVEDYTHCIREAIQNWRNINMTTDLTCKDYGDRLEIQDTRQDRHSSTSLTGVLRALYLACDCIHSLVQLQNVAEKETGKPWTSADIQELLGVLLEDGLMIQEGNRYLSLAILIP